LFGSTAIAESLAARGDRTVDKARGKVPESERLDDDDGEDDDVDKADDVDDEMVEDDSDEEAVDSDTDDEANEAGPRLTLVEVRKILRGKKKDEKKLFNEKLAVSVGRVK
jgi:hypothetical protein